MLNEIRNQIITNQITKKTGKHSETHVIMKGKTYMQKQWIKKDSGNGYKIQANGRTFQQTLKMFSTSDLIVLREEEEE